MGTFRKDCRGSLRTYKGCRNCKGTYAPYIDRIAFELQTKEVYLTANEVAKSYVSEMVLRYLDAILLYGKQSEWDSEEFQTEYRTSLEKNLEEIRAKLIPAAPQQAEENESAQDD